VDLWFVIAAPIVVAAFLAWYLWAQRRRRVLGERQRSEGGTDPRDAWDALSAGDDPTADDR